MKGRFLPLPKQQQGASAFAIIVVLGMAAVILTVAFKLYPAIYEQWQIENVITSFENEKDLENLSVSDVGKRFRTRLQTNNVRKFDFDENVLITMEDDILSIEVDYESRVNIYRNIDAVVVFQKSIEVIY